MGNLNLYLVHNVHISCNDLLPAAPRFEVNVSNGKFGVVAMFNELAGIWDGFPSWPITVTVPPLSFKNNYK